MAPTLLFATNNEGRAYALSTGNTAWREFLYLGLEFKKLSAVPHFIWAIGGDRQVYLHVHSLDVPIRVCEVSYENERWYPGSGWSQNLLPTDRPRFSTEDGLFDRDIQKIHLPSLAWQWDGDWQLDLTLESLPLNHDGWTYAVDFPRQYYPKMSTFTCVRRRKWIRFRKYCALNSWCAINPLHKDPTEEPFIDCSVGGTNLETGLMLVWAVTSHGRVMFRSGCSTISPEGRKWIPISTDCEVSQISVGATGMVWAACNNGRAFVRIGVTRDCQQGKTWLEVKPPGNNLKLTQISVGTNAVWAITNDHHVWFRKGINAATAGISEDAAIGTAWIEMVHHPMSSISVSANDQVFAVGTEDRNIYFRSGISLADLTGKKWKQIQSQMQMSRNSSNMSLSRRSSTGSDSRHRSLNSLKFQQQESRVSIQEDDEEQSKSAPTARQKEDLWEKPPPNSTINEEIIENAVASSCPVKNDVYEIAGRQLKNHHGWSPIRSVGSVVAVEANPESDCAVFESESGFSEDDLNIGSQYWTECDVAWCNVAAGAVRVDPNQLPNWFNDISDDSQNEITKPWRLKILENLNNRNEKEKIGYESYEKLTETSSWIKSGEVKMARYDGVFEDCLIELEWVSSKAGMDSGTLTVLNSDGITTKMQLLLNEITCIMTCSEPGYTRLAIYSPRLPTTMCPIKLQFAGDSDLEDWLSHLSSVTARLNNVEGCPSNDSIWITNNLGEIFVTDPQILREQQQKITNGLYCQEIDVSATETPYLIKLPNGMPYGSYLKITGCVYDDADQIRFDLQSNATVRLRHKCEYFRNMPLHLNPRFHEKCIVLNSMEMSNWENEIRESKMVFTPGKEFELVIKSDPSGYKLIVDDKDFTTFKHRSQNPNTIVSMHCSGRVKLFKVIYETIDVILSMNELFWRQMGGHLRKVETCSAGITWGISYDHNLWMYTKGWGGFLKGLEISNTGINNMTDTHHYYIYENQRWNPISGFSTASLPTDRHLWSDVTGRHKRSKEFNKLLSVHWQFVSDWLVDFHVPGGCDRDGWQYAVDFPMTYHAKKQFSDLVRRRRWYRKCRLNTKGPWLEIGQTKIIDVSLQSFADTDFIAAWAISSAGDALFRKNVSATNNAGNSWEHVSCDMPLISISCSSDNKVWVTTKSGTILFRQGITLNNPIGDTWKRIDSPSNVQFKQISAGEKGVWALDTQSRLAVRREITNAYPEGTHWQINPNIANDPPNLDNDANIGFKCVSVGKVVMAISNSGYLCKRNGITKDNPIGTGWDLGIMGNWNYLCVNGY